MFYAQTNVLPYENQTNNSYTLNKNDGDNDKIHQIRSNILSQRKKGHHSSQNKSVNYN